MSNVYYQEMQVIKLGFLGNTRLNTHLIRRGKKYALVMGVNFNSALIFPILWVKFLPVHTGKTLNCI